MVEQCAWAYDRTKKCTPAGFHWPVWMIVTLLRFVFYSVCYDQVSFTGACQLGSKIFCIKQENASKLCRMYLGSTEHMPEQLPRKKCGWGADSFQDKKDQYCILQEEVSVPQDSTAVYYRQKYLDDRSLFCQRSHRSSLSGIWNRVQIFYSALRTDSSPGA